MFGTNEGSGKRDPNIATLQFHFADLSDGLTGRVG